MASDILVNTGSDNGMVLNIHQAITSANAYLGVIGPIKTKSNKIWIKI